jgi:predicted Rossmann fold flavoprotein
VLIIDMLLGDCEAGNVTVSLETSVASITKEGEIFNVLTDKGSFQSPALVVATGGLSIPKMGASDLGYRLAAQFNIPCIPTRAALVPFCVEGDIGAMIKTLSGVSLNARASAGKATFEEGLLFTHRGLSGPAILQISSYWREGEPITLSMVPNVDILGFLKAERTASPKKDILTALAQHIPKRLASAICEETCIYGQLADISNAKCEQLATMITQWTLIPDGTEGYRTAEVTLGGVDTRALSSKTMECNDVKGLYFIGEVVDVTGHLGGFNFQWAWSSAFACANAL